MKSQEHKYPQKPGFNLPDDYFGNFEERMMSRIGEEKSSEIPGAKGSFAVPDFYFDSIEDRILKRLETEKRPVIKLWRKEYLYYAAAVMAILVMVQGNLFQVDPGDQIGWDDIEVSAMEKYIDEGYEMGYIDFNSSEYSDLIVEDGKLIDETDFNQINSEAAFDYISENVDDPALILE